MKMKKEYLILVAVIVLLSLYLVFHNSDRTQYQLPVIPEIVKKNISKIELSTSRESIVLSKQDDAWAIGPEGYPADDKKINSMLDVIDDLTLTDLVSESKSYVRYELDEEKKIHVKAYEGGDILMEFYIGKTAPSFRHTFIRLEGDPRVFYARDSFKGTFDQTVDNLRDKKVLSFDKTEIQALTIIKGETALVLAKRQVPVTAAVNEAEKEAAPPESELVWQNSDGEKIEESKINRLLSTLSSLNCDSYLDGVKKEDLKEALYSVTLKGAIDYSLSVFPKTGKDANEYPAVSSQNNTVFALSVSRSDNFMSILDEGKK